MKNSRVLLFVALLAKSAKLLKAAKFLKFGKLVITFITMSLSIFVYSFMMGIWFSVGFVLMLFIHEMGHVIALKIKKLPASAPVFIPMLGAVIFAPNFQNKENEAFVGMGGPLLGGLSAIVMFAVYKAMPNPMEIILLLSYTAAFINLFNLIPIRPLDGGRVTQAVGSWFKYVGIAGLMLFSIVIRQPVVLFIWILVLDEIRINGWLKFGIGVTCQVSMAALMYLGFSDQPAWVDVLDVAMVTIINMMYFFKAERGNADEVSQQEKVLPSKDRIKWFMLYCLLLITLSLLMFYQIPYLPKK